MQKRPNIGVVGCGYWGPNLIRNFGVLTECNLKSVCDADPDRLAIISARYPAVETHTSYDAFLANPDLDAVVIAVPVRYHYDLAKRSLQAGKHTFLEKPMASSVDECQRLITLANARRLTLMVGHTYLYSPAVRKIKEIIDSGEIGRIRYISSLRLNLGLYQSDINVVWDLAPHDLSIILHLMDQSPTQVNCRGKTTHSPNIYDVSNMSLVFSDGGFATIHNSWLDPKKVRTMAIIGDQKMIVYDDLEPQDKIKIYDTRVISKQVTSDEARISYHYGDMAAPYIPPQESLSVECAHFVDCIITGKTPLTCGVRGMELVHILERATESMDEHGNCMDIGSHQSSPRVTFANNTRNKVPAPSRSRKIFAPPPGTWSKHSRLFVPDRVEK